MKLKLIHAPNPDIEAGYWTPPQDKKSITLEVANCKKARLEWLDWINRNGLGGGNLTTHSGEILKNNKVIARLSYNGRLWDCNGIELTA